jgi:hypothetical protein
MNRELYDVWTVGNTVVVWLALQGTHSGPLETPFGTIPPTGKAMDGPCAEESVILTQLGVIFRGVAASSIQADSEATTHACAYAV